MNNFTRQERATSKGICLLMKKKKNRTGYVKKEKNKQQYDSLGVTYNMNLPIKVINKLALLKLLFNITVLTLNTVLRSCFCNCSSEVTS